MTVSRRYRPRRQANGLLYPDNRWQAIPLSEKEIGHQDVWPRISTHGAIYQLCNYLNIRDVLDAIDPPTQGENNVQRI